MAIIQMHEDQALPKTFTCSICGKEIPPGEAVAGSLDASNNQQFACNGHFWNPHQLIAGWADFMAAQRAAYTQNQFAFEYGEDMDARALR